MQLNVAMQDDCQPEVAKPKWPDWFGQTVVCVATGPSLTVEQCEHVRIARRADRCRVIAINEAGLKRYKPLAVPTADMLYAADAKFWRAYYPEFYGYRVCADDTGELKTNGRTIYPAIKTIKVEAFSGEQMSRELGVLLSAGHSGFQALGLALQLGASKIVLLGYDCGGKKRNCHDGRPSALVNSGGAFLNKQDFYNMVTRDWPHVEVLNCSPSSAITTFPVVTIQEALPCE